MKYLVKYEAFVAPKQKQSFSLGPYTIDEAITKRQEMARLDYVTSAFIDLIEAQTSRNPTP